LCDVVEHAMANSSAFSGIRSAVKD